MIGIRRQSLNLVSEVCLVDFFIIVSSLFLVISSPGFADGRPRCLSNLIPVSYILSSLVLV
jgi:hypothetical protein